MSHFLLHESLGHFRVSDTNGSRYRLYIFHRIHWMVHSVLNMKMPHFLLTIWCVQKVVFLEMALLASNPPTSFSPINTVSMQALCSLPVQQNLCFLLVCFALCVYCCRDYCFHIYSKRQGCKLVLVTN